MGEIQPERKCYFHSLVLLRPQLTLITKENFTLDKPFILETNLEVGIIWYAMNKLQNV